MACPCKVQKSLIKSRYQYDNRKQIYLDYNATTMPDRTLMGEYQNLSLSCWGHPMSPHGAGSEALKLAEEARLLVEKSFQDESFYYLFPPSGTQAILAGLACCQGLSIRLDQTIHYYPSAVCHPSVFKSLQTLGAPYTTVPVGADGNMKLPTFSEDIRPVVIYSPVNHETGGVEDADGIFRKVKANKGIIFADAVQAFTRIEEAAWLPFCDIFTISGHKFHVPRGIALLGMKKDLFQCLEQALPEYGNPVLQLILARGIEKYQKLRKEVQRRLSVQEKEALHYWKKMDLPFQIESPDNKVPGILNISLLVEGIDMEDLFLYLGRNHICISRFCACTGKVAGNSSVLLEMGRSMQESSRSLRISAGLTSASQDWITLGQKLSRYLNNSPG